MDMMNTSSNTTEHPVSSLSLMELNFLVVGVLATINLILGAIYGYIRYTRKRRHVYREHLRTNEPKTSVGLELELNHYRDRKRKMSTNLVLAVGQNRNSARRMSSAFL